jgi:2-dehydro-3-deoxyphosphooctonate aldolase (KDO 8-P synthase)
MTIEVARTLQKITENLGIPFIFKASFDKANRSSVNSFRGPGISEGIKIFKELKKSLNVPIITDIHEISQIEEIAEVVDVIQIPAFLCRQTDLIEAACKSNLPLNIKKGQFLSPGQMANIIDKCSSFGNEDILLCERGSSFGYNNLIVDFLGVSELKETQNPVILDVTHSLQLPGGQGISAGGRSKQALDLALCGAAIGLAGIFLEVHPNPKEALCDGPSATKLDDFKELVSKIKSIDDLAKTFN